MNKDMYDVMDLPELVALHKELGFYIQAKDDTVELEENFKWPELQDPWGEFQLPQFPLDTLPPEIADYCEAMSKQSGFDAGAYGFTMLCSLSGIIDHRARLDMGPFKVPPFLWGGLVDKSGGGKSPILSAGMRFVDEINQEVCKRGHQEQLDYENEQAGLPKKDRGQDKPPIRRLIVGDITTEKIAEALQGTPSGVICMYDEITEFIGRMDAYSSGGAGKDRSVYLKAWDGKFVTIDRVSKSIMIDNYSVGIIAGMQPEKLGELFRKSGGSSDGLYQRFLMYQMREPVEVNYFQKADYSSHDRCRALFNKIYNKTKNGAYSEQKFELSEPAMQIAQDFHNNCRAYGIKSGSERFAEHLNKLPGILGRIALTLHIARSESVSHVSDIIPENVTKDALRLLKTFVNHSMHIYTYLDEKLNHSDGLYKSACEAILSKGWTVFSWSDLTRNATYWRSSEERDCQRAIDMLIEAGWIHDVTPPIEPGRKGRRSAGKYMVNPRAHKEFQPHAVRIRSERSEKFKQIDNLSTI
jgi:hypothetical protein